MFVYQKTGYLEDYAGFPSTVLEWGAWPVRTTQVSTFPLRMGRAFSASDGRQSGPSAMRQSSRRHASRSDGGLR